LIKLGYGHEQVRQGLAGRLEPYLFPGVDVPATSRLTAEKREFSMNKMTILASASLLALSAGSANADYVLDILHINDLHSRIEPINRFNSTCSSEDESEGKCFGGIARVKTMIDQRRNALGQENANVLVLDAGDQFQGSLFYSTYKGSAAVQFLNLINPDAMAVGNHEFDDGPEKLAEFMDKAYFPVSYTHLRAHET